MDVALPLTPAYVSGQVGICEAAAAGCPLASPCTTPLTPTPPEPRTPLQPTACLRLDASGAWRSDAVSFSTAAAGVAHCLLSTTADNQVLLVQYVAEAGPEPQPSPGVSPGPADGQVSLGCGGCLLGVWPTNFSTRGNDTPHLTPPSLPAPLRR